MDSRFPTYYLNDRRVLRAKPDVFKLFVLATAWSVSNMTDGSVTTEDLYLIPTADEDAAAALVRLGLWAEAEDGWIIVDFEKTQTSAAQMETALLNRREGDRKRQQKKRRTDKEQSRGQSREGHVTSEGKEEEEAEARKGSSFDEGSSELEAETFDESDPWLKDTAPEHRCSVAACPGLVTPYLRNTYGQVCVNHAEDMKAAS